MASIYNMLWKATDNLAPPLSLTIITLLLVGGIYQPNDKTVWETLVVYFVTQAFLMQLGFAFGESAEMYYLWGEWNRWHEEAKEWCAQDENGDCLTCDTDDDSCKDGLEVANLLWSFGLMPN